MKKTTMKNTELYTKLSEFYFNKNKYKKINNSVRCFAYSSKKLYREHIRSYNCMGYALGIKEWLRPEVLDCFRNSDPEDEYYYEYDYDDEIETYTDYISGAIAVVEELVDTYKLKPVQRKDMVRGKEYIAFRMGPNDFHFLLRHRNGYWTGKMGSAPIRRIRKSQVFAPQWGTGPDRYDTPIYLFEKPEKTI